MKWTDTYEIAAALYDAHPDVDPKTLRFTQLREWVLALPGFNDDPAHSGEKIRSHPDGLDRRSGLNRWLKTLPDGSVLHCGGHSGSRNPGPDALRAVDDAGFGLPRGDIAARHVTWAGPHGIIKASSARLAPQRPADAFRTSLSARVFRPGLSDQGHSPSPFDRVHRCPLPNCVLDWPPTGCTMKPRCRAVHGCAPVPPPSVNWACSCTVGRTHDAIVREGMLRGYSGLIRYPYGREGGLMKLVARVTEGRDGQAPFDGAIYLIDPVDPSSIFPEALALKRQCITHDRPFISTLAGAIEWMEVERVHAGLTPDASLSRMFDYEGQTLALIAHDALKDEMVAFASEHFDVLSRFARRVATGTTGGRLNDLAWSRGWPKDKPWVHRYLSGPLGGDAQIAELVLEHQCQRVIFFEDPHVARQHEADIQLLERAVRVVTESATCATSPSVARRWAQAVEKRGA